MRIARKTRDLIDAAIGSYKSFRAETQVPGSVPAVAQNARALAHSKIPLLWVKGNDPQKAERAFFTINQSAVEIDATELKILNARTKPNAIAARAIVRNAAGHKYWGAFSPEGQAHIESQSQEIYKLLYTPPLGSPVRSEELPVAGPGYGTQTLPLIFDFVNIANDLPVLDISKSKRKLTVKPKHDDPDEAETIKTMKHTMKLCRMITSTFAGSLGLHPAVYFYSSGARHQPTTVLAMASLLFQFEKAGQFNKFTEMRGRFEDFLVNHKMYVNQLTSRHGSMAKGYIPIRDYYAFLLEKITNGETEEKIEESLRNNERFQFLVKERPITSKKAKDFSGDAKQAKFMKDALQSAFVCKECRARIDKKSMHLDHEEDEKDGGLADIDNGRWLHPFCDSTYKDYRKKRDADTASHS